MSRFRCNQPIAACLILAVVGISVGGVPQRADLGGRVVTMELVTNDTNQRLVAWPNKPPTLVARTVSINADDRIDVLLEGERIRADSEAYTLLYDLNPSVERLDQLPNGATLVIPYLGERERPSNGYVILLTVDKAWKDQLNADVDALRSLSISFDALTSKEFADPNNQRKTIAAVDELVRWFN